MLIIRKPEYAALLRRHPDNLVDIRYRPFVAVETEIKVPALHHREIPIYVPKRARRPFVGCFFRSAGTGTRQKKEPFDIRIEHSVVYTVGAQCPGEHGYAGRRFGRFGNRRINQQHI